MMISNRLKRYVHGTLMIAAALTAFSSELTDLPVKTVKGVTYHYYIVKKSETIYALCKRFGVSEAQLVKLNPDVAAGLKAGQEILLLPSKAAPAPKAAPAASASGAGATAGDNTVNGHYAVKKNDTAFGISKRFGLTLEEFYGLNPGVRDGVKEGQIVIVSGASKSAGNAAEANSPVSRTGTGGTTVPTAQTAAGAGRTHVIGDYETLYQIARDNGLPLSDLLKANPGLDPARYEAGTVINLPAGAKPAAAPASPAAQSGSTYTVKAGDTFYGIATRHGIEVNSLYEANPDIDILREGTVIQLPQGVTAVEEQTVNPANAPARVTIAVMLPFDLENKGKHNRSATEFYRGVLMAVDTMRHAGQPIRILTYDTRSSSATVADILARPEMAEAQAIIAPDNMDQLSEINAFGRTRGIAVVNPFNNRDSAYLTNPAAMQLALPRDEMYARAARDFTASFQDFTPVFLISNDGRKDKLEFVDVVKAELNRAGRTFKEIGYSGTLSADVLRQHLASDGRYAFLPASSHREEFDKVAPAIQEVKDARDFKDDIVVWGYPEWLANRQAYSKMHELDCYIYSRTDLPEKFTTESVDDAYEKWFGPEMMANYPRRYYMGFDIGMYLIKALSVNGGDFSTYSPYLSGITIPLSMRRVPGAGWYNNELLMINLAPGETISKRTI